jgi:hypothetical protein
MIWGLVKGKQKGFKLLFLLFIPGVIDLGNIGIPVINFDVDFTLILTFSRQGRMN